VVVVVLGVVVVVGAIVVVVGAIVVVVEDVDDVFAGVVVVLPRLPALNLSIFVIEDCVGRSTFDPEGRKETVMIEPPWTCASAGLA
jgi:hypothetical protein